jgi:hypothetical protein
MQASNQAMSGLPTSTDGTAKCWRLDLLDRGNKGRKALSEADAKPMIAASQPAEPKQSAEAIQTAAEMYSAMRRLCGGGRKPRI